MYGFFVTLFYTMLHVMVLTGFETVIHFVKKSKAWIFLQHAYEFIVVSTLADCSCCVPLHTDDYIVLQWINLSRVIVKFS
jgi:hypothetical protein